MISPVGFGGGGDPGPLVLSLLSYLGLPTPEILGPATVGGVPDPVPCEREVDGRPVDGRVDGRPEAVPGGVPKPESAFGFNGHREPDAAAAPTAPAPSSYLRSVKGSLPVDGPA